MIILFIIGIGIILAINLPKEKSEDNKKQTDKVKTSVVQMGGDSGVKVNDSNVKVNDSGDKQEKGKENQIAKTSAKVTPNTIIHKDEIFDVEKLNDAVKINGSRTTILEIPFFNIVFSLPKGETYRFLEKEAQIDLFSDHKDPNRSYIYTARFIDESVVSVDENGRTVVSSGENVSDFVKGTVIKDETLIGLSAFQHNNGARQYLENTKNNLANGKTLSAPEYSKLPEFGEQKIHDTTYFAMYVKEPDGRYSCEYATDYGGYVLHWKSVGTDSNQHLRLHQLLENTTITQLN
ncbi:MAG: hypothetical protein K0R18_1096 [Bacillales bacterium]|nr:hypothetical protein [Bacillales bacterium]